MLLVMQNALKQGMLYELNIQETKGEEGKRNWISWRRKDTVGGGGTKRLEGLEEGSIRRDVWLE